MRLLLLLLAACVLFCQANKFGEDFDVFNVSSGRIFGYKARIACIVQQSGDEMKVSLRNIDTVEQSGDVSIRKEGDTCVEACFEHRGSSFLWLRCANGTILLKGIEAVHLPIADYDLARFDHEEQSLYVLKGRTLSQYGFDEVWRSPGNVQPRWTVTLERAPSDLMIIGGHVFGVINGSVARLEAERQWQAVTQHSQDTFNFQLFLKEDTHAVQLAENLPSMLVFCVEIGAMLFLAYCLRYRLTYRTGGGLTATPPTAPIRQV